MCKLFKVSASVSEKYETRKITYIKSTTEDIFWKWFIWFRILHLLCSIIFLFFLWISTLREPLDCFWKLFPNWINQHTQILDLAHSPRVGQFFRSCYVQMATALKLGKYLSGTHWLPPIQFFSFAHVSGKENILILFKSGPRISAHLLFGASFRAFWIFLFEPSVQLLNSTCLGSFCCSPCCCCHCCCRAE